MRITILCIAAIVSAGCAANESAPAAVPISGNAGTQVATTEADAPTLGAAPPTPTAAPYDPHRRWHIATPEMPRDWRPDVGHGSGLGQIINENLQAVIRAEINTDPGSIRDRAVALSTSYAIESHYVLGEPEVINGPNSCVVVPFSSNGDLLRGRLAVCLVGSQQDHAVDFLGDWTVAHDVQATDDFTHIIRSAEMYQ